MISRHSEEVKIGPLFGNQFQIDPSTVPDALQLEFIASQSHSDFDGSFSKLLTFSSAKISSDLFFKSSTTNFKFPPYFPCSVRFFTIATRRSPLCPVHSPLRSA